jgi:hypothetical protein
MERESIEEIPEREHGVSSDAAQAGRSLKRWRGFLAVA